MSDLFQKLTKTGAAQAAEGAAPRLTLATFGKHPGWDDHMTGIGVDTETLAHIKQSLYVMGIGKQIDSGTWEKLEAEKRQEGFDHTFLWLQAGHLVLGQLWSSKDGKGRSKFPMVLCVDCERVSASLLLNMVRPGLEHLREACKAATTADQIASHCRAAQEQLQTLFADAGSAMKPGPNQPIADPRRFLESAELGPDRLGLLRVLHELNGTFDATGRARGPAQSGGAPPQSLHLRVPLAADSQNSALLLWSEFLRSALSPAIPLVLIARGSTDWLDLIVGEPKPDDFFCLQASRKGFPLATQIPYELAPNAKARLGEVEAVFLGGEPGAPQGAAKGTPAHANTTAATKKTASKLKTILGAGSVLVVLIAALIAIPGTSKEQKHFNQLLASGKAHLGEKKYDDAIHDLEEADKIHPQNDQIKQLLVRARQEANFAAIARKYQLAMKNGHAAFAHGDYANASALAAQALSIKPDDGDARQLRKDAQIKLDASAVASRIDADYLLAMKNGRDALARSDYTNALTQAQKALSLKPNDAGARQLHNDVQAKLGVAAMTRATEAGYRKALIDERAAFGRGDYSGALAQADKALSFKPNDADAMQLRNDAQAKLDAIVAASQNEAAYQSALKNGEAAFANGDYSGALAQADKALSFKPNDTDAMRLRNDAQAKLGAIVAASQNEAAYQSALKNGKAAFARGDYSGALAQADKALSFKPSDANAMQLRNDAQAKLGAIVAANQHEAAYQAAMKNGRAAFARGDYTDALAQADKAQSFKPKDADARQLSKDAQTKLDAIAAASQNEAAYQSAMKNGNAAYARGDFTGASAQAEKALSLKPDDANARQLRKNAQTRLEATAAASQNETAYQLAMTNGREALAHGNSRGALAFADQALSLKPDDADAKQLHKDAQPKPSESVHTQVVTNSIGMVFVWVPGVGAFVGKYEVTEKQYQTIIMGKLPNNHALADPKLPVDNVTFDDATHFCEELSKRDKNHYTLPTKQQWLSAAGLTEDQVANAWDILSASHVLDHEVTSLKVRQTKPAEVGSQAGQTNGLFDMFGNVREWVTDQQGAKAAGFSFRSKPNVPPMSDLFVPKSAYYGMKSETGIRCILQESQPQ